MTGRPKDFLDRNLMAIIAAGLAGYGGYITGMVKTTAKIEALEQRAVAHEQLHQRQRPFLECMVRHFDQIEGGVKQSPCPLAVPE